MPVPANGTPLARRVGEARARAGDAPEPQADRVTRVRLQLDCALSWPVDEVLLRRLNVEAQRAEPDPDHLLRLVSRLLESTGARAGTRVELDVESGPDVRATTAQCPPGLLARLTPRERCVVLLALEGLRNKEIARRLCRSVRTVECQISSALRKLQVCSRMQLLHVMEAARVPRDGQAGGDTPVPSSMPRNARAALESVRPPCTT